MAEKADVKVEALPDLDDLLQCPVCYEIPSGNIYQCNEGHHVCGQCKDRLQQCPVCRAMFFGTRNYAMEELISNIKKLRAFKLGGKVTVGSGAESEATRAEEAEDDTDQAQDANSPETSSQVSLRAPQACKGLFRCLCCKNGNCERLPAGRLLNHLRYYHNPELIEGKSENGVYVQAWQIATVPGRVVTAVRVADMGIFFLVIEMSNESVCAWVSMAASPWVASEYNYTLTISGNDREAIFSDCVWSVRACEGSLRKRGHCLHVTGRNARALSAAAAVSSKLSVSRAPEEQALLQPAPRAVVRVADRGSRPHRDDLEPFFQDLQNDVARLSRAFATLGREANELARIAHSQPAPAPPPEPPAPRQLSRSARRRMRQRMRAAMGDVEYARYEPEPEPPRPAPTPRPAPAPAPAPSSSAQPAPAPPNPRPGKKRRTRR